MDDPEPYSLLLSLLSDLTFTAPNWQTYPLLFAVIILLIISALVSGSEVALFSLSPTERESLENGGHKYSLVLELLSKPRKLLATILVVNNFVNIAIVIISTFIVNALIDFSSNQILEFVIQVILITFVILLFGEVIPKVYATKNGLKLAVFMAYPLMLFSKLFSPIIFVLLNSTSFIERRVKWKGHKLSSEDLSSALELTSDEEIKDEDQKILEGIVKFGNTDVKQIMVSRVDAISIDKNTKFDEVLKIIHRHRFSRMPVYEDSFDRIVGTLYIKDLLPHLNEGAYFDWTGLIRKPFFVPENKKIDDLLKEFQEKKIHLAVVVDEYGGASGIITLEDVLSEVVGDISKEVQEDELFQKLDDFTYIFDGKVPLIDFYRVVNADANQFEKVKGESDTLAGFILEITGRIPKKLEKFEFAGFKFIIESANIKRVKEIKVLLPDGKKY